MEHQVAKCYALEKCFAVRDAVRSGNIGGIRTYCLCLGFPVAR